MNNIFRSFAIFAAVTILASASALADRGRGSIRAAARPEPPRPEVREAPRAEVRQAPRPAPPPRVDVRRDEHPAPQRIVVPARRDWDENDEDARHFGGFAHGVPAHIIRGEHVHDLPHEHREIEFNHHRYFFDDVGICYDLLPDGQYVVIQPPIGVLAPLLPSGAIPIVIGPTTYYYLDGIFYIQQGDNFTVVNPPPGITVPLLPSGAQQLILNGSVTYQFNGFNYLPSLQDGVTVYTVTPA